MPREIPQSGEGPRESIERIVDGNMEFTLKTIFDEKGVRREEYFYDNHGRLFAKLVMDENGQPAENYHYDPKGQMDGYENRKELGEIKKEDLLRKILSNLGKK